MILRLLAVTACAAALTGCGGDDEAATPPQPTVVTNEDGEVVVEVPGVETRPPERSPATPADPAAVVTAAPPPGAGPGAPGGPMGNALLRAADDRLHPGRVELPAGLTLVTVVNQDPHRHVLAGRGFARQELARQATVAVVAPESPGTYFLVCRIHPQMKARVRVVG